MPLVPFGSKTNARPGKLHEVHKGKFHRGSHNETIEKGTAVSIPNPSMPQGAGLSGSGRMPERNYVGRQTTSTPVPGNPVSDGLPNRTSSMPKRVRGSVRRK